jgi:UDP-N-acetylglucosamine:LPS N-acetylglucosamine transferase
VENAGFFAREGAAAVLGGASPDGDREATVENLSRTVNDIADDTRRREVMAESAGRIGSLDGAAIIGDSINKFVFGTE